VPVNTNKLGTRQEKKVHAPGAYIEGEYSNCRPPPPQVVSARVKGADQLACLASATPAAAATPTLPKGA